MLVAASPEQATVLLARSLLRYGGVMSWRLEECLDHVIRNCDQGRVDVRLALSFTTSSSPLRKDIELALSWIADIFARDHKSGLLAWRRLLARIQAVAHKIDNETRDVISDFADDHQLPQLLAGCSEDAAPSQQGSDYSSERQKTAATFDPPVPLFPVRSSLLAVARSLKGIRVGSESHASAAGRLANALGYRILQLALGARRTDAAWLIATFAREARFDAKTDVLARIADGLVRHGENELAAGAYVLAGWYFLAEQLWFTTFDAMHLEFFEKGWRTDGDAAGTVLANEVVQQITGGSGYYFGIACRLVQSVNRSIGGDTAFACWQEACRVIQHRLPEWQSVPLLFLPYIPSEDLDWSIDEALCYLLLSRVSHPNLERRQAALTGLADLLRRAPDCLGKALQTALDSDTPVTSLLLMLATLLEAEQPPFVVSRHVALSLQRLKHCDIYGLRVVAERLLERIEQN